MGGKRFRILLAVPYPRSATLKQVLQDAAKVDEKHLNQEGLEKEMKKDYDAVICSFWQKITRDMILSSPPTLKAIATLSVGFDHIDVDAAKERGIEVINAARGDICASAYSVAEHAFGLLLDLVRKNSQNFEAVKSGTPPWVKLAQGTSPSVLGTELFDKTLGIIGVGRIGSHSARIGRGFHMKVIGYDPYIDRERALEDGARLVNSLEELLSNSDFISIHPCLTEETGEMIGKKEVSAMKDGVYIVNTARGRIVDEPAIIGGLRSGKIAGYAADVLTGEPPNEETSPLLATFRRGEFPNLLITPHIAWVTAEATKRYALIVGEKIREVLTQL